MELPLVNVSTCELRFVIRFFTAKNETAVNIHRNLVSVYGEGCMSIQMVRRWRSWYLEGRQNLHDAERSGRPVTATDNAAVAAVRNVMEADRRVSIDEIMIRLTPGIKIERSSIGTIMLVVLNFRKVCAIWFPRLLSENHKQQRMEAARAFLEMHRRDGDQLFSPIVNGDESWVHQSTPETKRQSMVWKKPEEGVPKKAKFTISAGKVMAIVFWDCKGVFLVDYLSPNTTVNAAGYCEFLTKLRTAIKRKHSGPWNRKVLLVHDNARPHAIRTTQTLLENFKWEIFTHPTYSPELAPSDFHLFPALKLHLGGKHFANDDEVQAEANHWLRRQDTAWGMVHHEFLPQGRTVNKEYYLQVMRNLREAILQKRPDLWKNKNWLLHHDNAPAHASLLVRDLLAKNNTLMMPQPPYSPDLAPCDFFLFPKLKRPMKGRRYATLDEIKTASKEELKKIFKNDFLKYFED
ncbi:hypothetical protein LAZ67_X001959 [Cordylochernes scorpioides]|uniref:Mos1 transposase HTH domain-containing protein n=1 Tax=Cordylochernes scorpioides TaxID=51811 RepID=A0ABY6LSZ2_9ARAC|nr:hypothetical protein LAZ67_X001959 [Cordylochernes scorpioides]